MYAYDPKYTTVRNRVKNLIAEGLLGKTEDITDYTTLKADLNIDSLDMIELVIALEDEFDITISDEETAKLSSVEEVVYLVMESGSAL
jgi:acyl carrier protein